MSAVDVPGFIIVPLVGISFQIKDINIFTCDIVHTYHVGISFQIKDINIID